MTGQSVSVPIYRERLHPGVWLVRALGGVRCDPVQLACLLSCCSRVSVRSQAPCSPMPRLATRRATHDWLPDLHWKPPPRLPHSHRLPLSGGAGPPDGVVAKWFDGPGRLPCLGLDPEAMLETSSRLDDRRVRLPATNRGAPAGGVGLCSRDATSSSSPARQRSRGTWPRRPAGCSGRWPRSRAARSTPATCRGSKPRC